MRWNVRRWELGPSVESVKMSVSRSGRHCSGRSVRWKGLTLHYDVYRDGPRRYLVLARGLPRSHFLTLPVGKPSAGATRRGPPAFPRSHLGENGHRSGSLRNLSRRFSLSGFDDDCVESVLQLSNPPRDCTLRDVHNTAISAPSAMVMYEPP
jgi:hypothetical protein